MFTALLHFVILLVVTPCLLILVLSTIITAYIKFKFESVRGLYKSNVRLDNKIVLVTGGNQGIGFETVKDFASRGARIVIACRDGKKSAEAIADITNATGNKNIEYKYLDLAKFSSVRQFAAEFNNTYDRLDILVNNAGCGGLKHKASEDGIDMVMQVNYLGPFLLTNLLLDKLKASEAGRIIIVSSLMHLLARLKPNQINGMHTTNQVIKYSNSKLCDLLWTKALAKRLPSNVTVNALHPGAINTDIFRRLHPILRHLQSFLMTVFRFKTVKEGAQTTIYLSVSEEVAGVSGKYFLECKQAEYSRYADDDELVEQVWSESVRLTNSKPDL